jgi:hypothetical protein
VSVYQPYSHTSLKRLGITSSSIFSVLLVSSDYENNSGSGEHLWLSSRLWKQPRIGSSVSLSVLLSSKPEKTWDCELKHLFSSFALIRLWKQLTIDHNKTNIDEEYHLYFISHESRLYIALLLYKFCLEFFKRRIFLVGWYATYSLLLLHLQPLTCMCLVQRLLQQ